MVGEVIYIVDEVMGMVIGQGGDGQGAITSVAVKEVDIAAVAPLKRCTD